MTRRGNNNPGIPTQLSRKPTPQDTITTTVPPTWVTYICQELPGNLNSSLSETRVSLAERPAFIVDSPSNQAHHPALPKCGILALLQLDRRWPFTSIHSTPLPSTDFDIINVVPLEDSTPRMSEPFSSVLCDDAVENTGLH